MRSLAEALPEGSAEVALAEGNQLRQSLYEDRSSKVLAQIGFDAALLPRRKAAACVILSRRRSLLAPKNLREPRESGLRGLRIMGERPSYVLENLFQDSEGSVRLTGGRTTGPRCGCLRFRV